MANDNIKKPGYFKQNHVYGAHDFAWANLQNYQDLDEDAFMEYIKRYEGTSYYEQAMNALQNYKSNQWSPNAWQMLGANVFGDVSPYINFMNTKNSTLTDAMSRIEDAFHQEGYNSAEQQAERQRSAGLNPDLTGGVSSGDAGNVDNLELAQPALNDGSSVLPEVASQAMQVISLGMSLAQGIQGLNAGEIQIGLDSLNLYDKSNSSVLDSLGNALSESTLRILLDPYAVDKDKKPLYDDDMRISAEAHLLQALSVLSNDKRLPRSLRHKLEHSYKPTVGSVRTNSEFYKLLSDVYANKKNAVGLAGDPFNRGGFEECLTIVGDHIQKTIYDVQKLSAKFETDRLSVTSDGTPKGESLGTLAGRSDASAFTSEAYQKEYDAIVNKMWDDIMKDLSQGKDKDKWWSKVLRFAIPIVRLWLGNLKMPSVSHSTSTGVGKNGQPVQNSSSSWSF